MKSNMMIRQPLIPLFLMLLLGAVTASAERIVFLGDSLTAGYGLDPEQAYPQIVERLLEEAGHSVETVNAGVSGDTTAGGLRRIDWLLRQEMDILFIALGANDALRGQSVEAARENLEKMIDRARETYPDLRIILAGMLAPPNMGEAYRKAFREIYPRIARDRDVELMAFLLDGVAGQPSLNLPDGIHPNAKGQRIIARAVVEALDLGAD
jgi:acyl-CoA thioesterase-1